MARPSASRRSTTTTLLIAVTALSTAAALAPPPASAQQPDSVSEMRKRVGGAVRHAGAAADTPRAMSLVDIMNVPRIGSPRLSPDGTRLVYTRSTADWKKNERVSHLWLVGVDGSGARQLTRGEEGESSPRWSPDGKAIAFLAKREGACPKADSAAAADSANPASDTTRISCDPDHPVTQLWLLPLTGGDARPLTHHATAVSDPTWSRDGRWIYFLASEPPTKAEKAREKAKNDVYAFDEDYHQRRLWRVDPESGQVDPVTAGDFSVWSYSLSADGKRVAIERAPTPLYGDAGESEVWVMGTDGGGAVRVTRDTVPEYGPELSPDGSKVLFTSMSNRDLEFYYNPNLFVADVPSPGEGPAEPGATDGPAVRMLLPDEPWEMGQAHWSADGSHVLVQANEGVREDLFRVPAGGGKPERLTPRGDHSIGSWSWQPWAGASAFTLEGRAPGEAWVLRQAADGSASGEPRQVTHDYDDFARRWKLPREEAITWKGRDGVTVEGLLFYPLGWEEGGRPHPLVVQAHGGPMSSSRFGFQGVYNHPEQLTAMGYFVLQPNYRGSTAYGDAFMRDMLGHYYHEAHRDVMAGVDALVGRGLVSPDSLAMMGWSAGGHMTDKLITYTDRFKAAASGAGASDWISMYAQSDVRVYRTPWFGGSPWQKNAPIDAYWDASPIKDVSNVKTPTIFMVGREDPRVPMPQSVEMYRGVKAQGVPTHLYVAPREPHGWRELRHRLFKANVETAWFERWVRGRDYAWEKAPGDSGEESVTSAGQVRAGG